MTDFKDILDLEEEAQDILDSSQTHDAPFALLIEDIDRPQDRNLVYKILSESQVDIDLEAVKQQLDEGHVLITHLNEAKASIIVDQIKEIDADIRFGLPKDLKIVHKEKESVTPEKESVTPAEAGVHTGHPEDASAGHPERVSAKDLHLHKTSDNLILTTAPSIQGKSIQKYLGIITAELKVQNPQNHDELVEKVLDKMKEKALTRKAHAVIAISFDTQYLPDQKAYLFFAVGTAVQF